jgi:hypothetical protein
MHSQYCSKELEEYQENLNKQIDEISNCINKKKLNNEEKKKCVMNYLETLVNPLIKCSKPTKTKKSLKKSLKKSSKKSKKTKKTNKISQIQKIQPKSQIKKYKKNVNKNVNKNVSMKTDVKKKVIEKTDSSNDVKEKLNNNEPYLKISLGRLDQQLSTENIGMYIDNLKEKETGNGTKK